MHMIAPSGSGPTDRPSSRSPVEVVVVRDVALDGREEHEDVLELLEQEEARGHALPARDGVAL